MASLDRGNFGMPTVGSVMKEALVEEDIMRGGDFPPRGDVMRGHYRVVITDLTVKVEYGDKAQVVEAASEDARYILSNVLPMVLTEFLEKNAKYAAVEDGYDLGAKGIIPDLNRKLGILKARLWDDAEEVGESTDEVARDMIGHLLLFLAKRR